MPNSFNCIVGLSPQVCPIASSDIRPEHHGVDCYDHKVSNTVPNLHIKIIQEELICIYLWLSKESCTLFSQETDPFGNHRCNYRLRHPHIRDAMICLKTIPFKDVVFHAINYSIILNADYIVSIGLRAKKPYVRFHHPSHTIVEVLGVCMHC